MGGTLMKGKAKTDPPLRTDWSGFESFSSLQAAYAQACHLWDIRLGEPYLSLTFGVVSYIGDVSPRELEPRVVGYGMRLHSVVDRRELVAQVVREPYEVRLPVPRRDGGLSFRTYRLVDGLLHGQRAIEYSDGASMRYRMGHYICHV
jgi:hypothetical protein